MDTNTASWDPIQNLWKQTHTHSHTKKTHAELKWLIYLLKINWMNKNLNKKITHFWENY